LVEEETEVREAAGTGSVWITGVRFRRAGKIYDFDPGSLILTAGDKVVVETERGTALGEVAVEPQLVPVEGAPGQLRKVLKKADVSDLHREEANKRKEKEAFHICLNCIRRRGLAMKLVEVEYLFDASKAIFYFCAEGRIDFRDLVRDLAQALHTRIEMKQIGARDETKLVGGIGPCGQSLCCNRWLHEFQAVSVKMAKDQGLSLNPGKLAGQCGRLKCCLRYECDTYCTLKQTLPRIGSQVRTPKGTGAVIKQNILAQKVTVKLEESPVEAEFAIAELNGP